MQDSTPYWRLPAIGSLLTTAFLAASFQARNSGLSSDRESKNTQAFFAPQTLAIQASRSAFVQMRLRGEVMPDTERKPPKK